jgi:DNA replicative helicase MCM subunit Mcm2 (Cdc46/Mcm family)
VRSTDTYTPEELAAAKTYIEKIIQDDNPIDFIPRLICPSIIGNEDAKVALTCMLASQHDTTRARQRIHLLFHGIAGTAKTGLIEWLVDSWEALYISMEAKESTLKGDGRRSDGGVKLLNAYDRGIVCMDDFERFGQKDMLRDVLEKGYYTMAKGGKYRVVPARIRMLSACNDISGISEAMRSRFDIACYFDVPDIEESVEIAKSIATEREGSAATDEIVRVYMALANEHVPAFDNPDRLGSAFERHFKREGSGKTGRWIASVYRIAGSIARLRFGDITEREVKWALDIKVKSDDALEEMGV